MNIRAIDLFCGAGGSSWGAHSAGVEIVAGFDIWPLAGKAHQSNFPQSQFFLGRIEEMDINSIVARLGKIDLILASPECTNHSPAKGGKPRCEKSKETAFQIVRFANAFQPRWLIIENVVGMRKWSRYAELKQQLTDAGYQLSEQVLDATWFGVGQSRRRLFLLADKKRMPSLIPKGVHEVPTASSFINLNGAYKWSLLRTESRAPSTIERAERGIKALGNQVPFLLVYYGSDAAGGWQALNRPLRTITTVDRFAIVKPTLEGHYMRMLQVAELQQAMGMDGMKFEHGTRRDRIKMIGNAVCPPVMREVVKHLISEGE